MNDAELFTFALDGAVVDLPSEGHRMLMKPYKLGSANGYLSLSFVTNTADSEVTKDNAISRGMVFYVRGDSSYHELVKQSFGELGLESWEGRLLEDINQAKTNEDYFCYGFFEYEGITYEGRVHYITEQAEPYYIEEVETLLGDTWPEVSFHIVKWDYTQ